MKVFLLSLMLIFSSHSWGAIPVDHSVVGCKDSSKVLLVELNSEIEIQKTYLDRLNKSAQQSFISEAIETQVKHLVGAFKEFYSPKINKLALGAFRGKQKVVANHFSQTDYPDYPTYWPQDRGNGGHDYVRFLMAQGVGKKTVQVINYKTEVMIQFCGEKTVTEQEIFNQVGSLPIPKDPYIGFWINTPQERVFFEGESGPKIETPQCFSREFGDFGVPHQAWFFWSPVHKDPKIKCKIENQNLITHFKLWSKPLGAKNIVNDLKLPGAIKGAAFFGAVSKDSKYFYVPSGEEVARVTTSALQSCKESSVSRCMTKWTQARLPKDKKKIEVGADFYFLFMKYLSALVEFKDHELVKKDKEYFILKLNVQDRLTQRRAQFNIYYGPTSLYKSLLGPQEYWTLLEQSLYESDFVLYMGHSGLGDNLSLEFIKQKSAYKRVGKQRARDLVLGIINCEGFSYFGYDYKNLFKQNSTHHIDLITSSGYETKSDFIIGLTELLLRKSALTKKDVVDEIGQYVNTQDFLTYQKIKMF